MGFSFVQSPLYGGVVGGNADPAIFNFNPSQMTKWKSGVARVRSSMGRAKVIFVGDSTTWGEDGGDTVGLRNNSFNNSVPGVVSSYFNTNGLPSAHDSLFGSGGNAGATVIADFRNSYKSGFNAASPWLLDSVLSLGGCVFSGTGVDSTGITYTPAVPVTNFEIGDLQASGAGQYTYQIDGGANTFVTETNANSALTKQAITGLSLASHTLTIKVTSGKAFIRHVKGWDSTKSQIDILNAGRSSSNVTDWTINNAPYNTVGALTDEANTADLVVINLGINDNAAGTTQAAFKTSYQTVIACAQAGGASVILVVPHQTDTTIDASQSQANIKKWIRDLAITNNLPVIDLTAHFSTFIQMTGRGYMFGARHCQKAGYLAEGTYIGSVLKKWAS